MISHSDHHLPSPAPRKSHSVRNTSTPPKYCSDRCRREKLPAHGQGIEATIERTFVQLLGPPEAGSGKPGTRKIVLCGDVEQRVFGRLPNRGTRRNKGDESSEERSDSEVVSEVKGSDLEEPDEDESDGGVAVHETREAGSDNKNDQATLTPQQAGRRRAANREKVRQAARRGVVFGFCIDAEGYIADANCSRKSEASQMIPSRVRAEAVQGGRVVEASFAKGEWGVRWRDVA